MLALAAVKRIREIVFVLWGFGLGSFYSLRSLMRDAETRSAEDAGGDKAG